MFHLCYHMLTYMLAGRVKPGQLANRQSANNLSPNHAACKNKIRQPRQQRLFSSGLEAVCHSTELIIKKQLITIPFYVTPTYGISICYLMTVQSSPKDLLRSFRGSCRKLTSASYFVLFLSLGY